jgi:chromosomal replication initiator protein
MYLARSLTGSSYPEIGDKVGGRDHSTVIYAFNKIKKSIETDARIKNLVQEIENLLLNKS